LILLSLDRVSRGLSEDRAHGNIRFPSFKAQALDCHGRRQVLGSFVTRAVLSTR